MWIVLRLILAAIGFGIRQWRRRKKPTAAGMFDDTPWFEEVYYNKSRTTGFSIAMPRASPTWARLHAESRADRLFKRIGIANEVQTGDPEFDELVYVTCDHPHVTGLLRETAELRRAIVAAFRAGFKEVRFDGRYVWLRRDADTSSTETDRQVLQRIQVASARLDDEPASRLADPFLWKALVVEGLIWAIAGYAIGAAIEQMAYDEDYHVDKSALIGRGLGAGAAGFVLLLGIITLWMRGSSRGHRIIIESALVLVIALPITGIQTVGDTNRALDDAPATTVARQVAGCEVRRHTSKNRTSYTYHLGLVPEPERTGPLLPPTIEVTKPICDGATPGAPIELEIKPGRWGVPWYREIRVGGVTWTSRH